MPIKPGFYGAKGDPWSYVVLPDGRIFTSKEGDTTARFVDEDSAAHKAIVEQIESGQLGQGDSILGSADTKGGPTQRAAVPSDAGATKAPYSDRLDDVAEKHVSAKPDPAAHAKRPASDDLPSPAVALIPGVGEAALGGEMAALSAREGSKGLDALGGAANAAGDALHAAVTKPGRAEATIGLTPPGAITKGGMAVGAAAGRSLHDLAVSALPKAADEYKALLDTLKRRLYGKDEE